ncbi:MAG: sugar ABC transporter permease [Gammaproteobacteria bacterium]|nr:sugar ABC transporter permease [Gammaproteobacteria bacterium]
MKTRKRISKTAAYTIVGITSTLWILPLIWMIIQSFAGPEGSYQNGSLFPKTFSLYWYKMLFTDPNYPYWRWFLNTLLIAVICLVLSTFFTIAMAYCMSRYRFKSRKLIQSIGLILGMFPGFMSMAAIYYIFKSVGMVGDVAVWKKMIALILVYSGGAGLNYYVSKGFFDTVSKSLDEAARIDGSTNSEIFFKIILPLSKPIIVYTALMSFLGPWGDFIFASYLLGTQRESWTVAVGLYELITKDPGTYYNMFMAGAVFVAVPITALFLFLQRYFVEGITGGAVKG